MITVAEVNPDKAMVNLLASTEAYGDSNFVYSDRLYLHLSSATEITIKAKTGIERNCIGS